MNMNKKILTLAIILGLLLSTSSILPLRVDASVYDYEITSVTRTAADEITVSVQVRYCSACNPNDVSSPGCMPFTCGHPPPYYPYSAGCSAGYPDGRFVAVRIKDGTGTILGTQKLVCNPTNWPLNMIIARDFVFTGVTSVTGSIIAEADVYCSWCGHWYPSPKSLEVAPLKVLIDPGHSPTDPNPDKQNEYFINKGVADKLQLKLEAEGVDVYLTNSNDSITNRINYANNLKPTIFVSLHCNAYDGTVRGSEVWVYDDTDSSEQAINEHDLAVRTMNNLILAISSELRLPMPKEKQSPWPSGIPILTGVTVCPAVLLEMEFFDYASDVTYKGVTYANMLTLMNTEVWREDAAQGIANGIIGYFEEKGLTIAGLSPIDIVVTDPDGLRISKQVNEIPGATYNEVDLDGDGDLDDQIRIPDRKIGEYVIEVVPEPDALPTDTFTLEVSLFGESIIIAQNVQVSDIPDEPYTIISTETGIIPPIIPATIDFAPDVLNLNDKGKYVTVYIELPPGYDVSQIDIGSVRLNDTVPALGKPTEIGDHDNDGIADLMVKFHRTMVQDALTVCEEVGVAITGEVAGITFEGSDSIRVITAAPPGRGEWTRVSTPTTEGWGLAPDSVIVDYAVADDGDVAYAIVYSYGDGEFHLLKSADYAATWEDIMDALEEEANGEINWLVAVATDAEDADFVAVAPEMTDLSVHVFISDDGGATFEDAGEVEDGGVYFPDGYYVSDLEVSPEVSGTRDIAIGGMDWSGALLFRSTVIGDSASAWEDTTTYPGWDDDGDFDSELVTDIVFSPSWAADKTILVTTVATGATYYDVYLQCGSWGTSEGWNEMSIMGIEAVPIIEDVDIPMWLADFDAKAIAGITVPMDYSGRNSNSRYAWVWVNYYDYAEPVGTIFRVKNKSIMEVNQQIEDLPWLTNVSYYGTIAEGEAIAGLLGTGWYVSSPDELLTECCEGVQVYRNDNIYNMDICCMRWEEACKPPTGTFAMEAFYVGEDKAYAVSLWGFFLPYDEDAWSVSFDDGDNWNQLSLVDTKIDYMSDVAISPDCNRTMLVSVNDDNGCGCDSVWLHAENLPEAPEYSGKWLRTWCGQLEGHIGGGWERGLLRLAPGETTGDNVYLFDYGTDNVYWNEVEGLACWDFGSASVDDIVDLAVLDKETIYALDYNGDVAMSDDYAIGWYEPVDSKVEYGWTIAVWGDYVLVGGEDGDVSYSDDDGETFTELEDVATSGFVTVAFDSYFDANDTIYAALANAGDDNGIYRWVIGESTDWENLGAADYDYTGLVLDVPSGGKPKTSADTGGVLYASYVSGDTSGVARCLTPAEDVCCSGTDWDYLTRGLTSELFKMTPQALKICNCLTADLGSRLFAIDSSDCYDMESGITGTVWSFED